MQQQQRSCLMLMLCSCISCTHHTSSCIHGHTYTYGHTYACHTPYIPPPPPYRTAPQPTPEASERSVHHSARTTLGTAARSSSCSARSRAARRRMRLSSCGAAWARVCVCGVRRGGRLGGAPCAHCARLLSTPLIRCTPRLPALRSSLLPARCSALSLTPRPFRVGRCAARGPSIPDDCWDEVLCRKLGAAATTAAPTPEGAVYVRPYGFSACCVLPLPTSISKRLIS